MDHKHEEGCSVSLGIKNNTTSRPREWLKLKPLTIPGAVEDVKKLEFPMLFADGKVNGTVVFENYLAVFTAKS